jgi:predicted phosphodiesterase
VRYIKALFGKYDHKWTEPPKNTQGLTRFLVGNDWHIGSKYQDNPFITETLYDILSTPVDPYLVLNGDIFDFTCAPKSELPHLYRLYEKTRAHLGNRLISGNHDTKKPHSTDLILETGSGKRVLFEHGDLISDHAKWAKYREREHGASNFKLFQTALFDNMDWVKSKRPLPKGFIERASQRLHDLNCDVLVVGHFHVESERRYNFNRKTIVILPAHRLNKVWL